jgi:hypothetical protein
MTKSLAQYFSSLNNLSIDSSQKYCVFLQDVPQPFARLTACQSASVGQARECHAVEVLMELCRDAVRVTQKHRSLMSPPEVDGTLRTFRYRSMS